MKVAEGGVWNLWDLAIRSIFLELKRINLGKANKIEVNQLFIRKNITMEQNNGYYQLPSDPQLQGGLDIISQAVQGEIKDASFYNYLASKAVTSEEKVILNSIKEEELKHSKQLEEIYRNFLGRGIQTEKDETFEIPNSYQDGIKTALFDELRDVVKYRAIRKRLPERIYKDALLEIITDELMHASMLNYLLVLNSDIKNSSMNGSLEGRYTTGYHVTNTFTIDDWANYIMPLVNRAQLEARENNNPENLFRKYILAGVLLGGQGLNPQEAIDQIEEWKETGVAKLLRDM